MRRSHGGRLEKDRLGIGFAGVLRLGIIKIIDKQLIGVGIILFGQ
jgi:hypothetical protein